MPDTSLDIIVIGAGPAGYVSAIRCAQLGMNVTVVDQWIGKFGHPALGGTCLNVGCIPSKALLESSERYHETLHANQQHGIQAERVSVDIAAMLARKDSVVAQLTSGIEGLFKANGIQWIQGKGKLLSAGEVEVARHDGSTALLQADKIILASGSVPVTIPALPIDGNRIVDSSGALEFDRVPEKLAVIGAGVIGLELGSVWSRLGAEVIVLEAMDTFMAMADKQIAREALRQFKAQGLDIRLSSKVTKSNVKKSGVTLNYTDRDGEHSLTVDKVLVAVGRRPYLDGLVAEDAGLALTESGFIRVDENCATSIAGVYAIGDCVPGPMLAHKGSEEGIAVAEHLAGYQADIDGQLIPSVVYTEPELAWVGETEASLQSRNIACKTGMFPFAATGRALAVDATAGFVKIIADEKTDRVLGVHIIGKNASEFIAEAVMVMAFEGCAEDLARTIHAHPTLSEALHEAALDVEGIAIHKAGKRRPR